MTVSPRKFGDVLNEWFRMLRRAWHPLLLSSLLIHVPLAVVVCAIFWLIGPTEAIELYLDPELLETRTDEEILDAFLPFIWSVGAWSALQAIAAVFVYLAGTRTVVAKMAGLDFSWREVSRFAATRLVTGVASSLLVFSGAMVLLGLAGALGWALISGLGAGFLTVFVTTSVALTSLVVLIWLGLGVSLGAQVIAVEDAGPATALARSFSLIQGRWWVTFGFLILTGLIASAVSQAASIALLPIFLAGLIYPEALIIGFGATVVLYGPLIAALAAAYALWYIDLRARREGLTAEQLI